MTKDETIALWKKCEAARIEARDAATQNAKDEAAAAHEAATANWNCWALDLISRREEFERKGTWENVAKVIFSTENEPHSFDTDADFSGWIFPGKAHFESAIFKGEARFLSTKFCDTYFTKVTFEKSANFFESTFSGSAFFVQSIFKKKALFDNSRFMGLTAFSDTIFEESAQFLGVLGKRAFGLWGTKFFGIPDFRQSHFDEAPDLEFMEIRPYYAGQSWHTWTGIVARFRRLFPWSPTRPYLYRDLRRLAIQGHDDERALDFFAREICARRFTSDWPLPTDINAYRWLPRFLQWVPFVIWRPYMWVGFFRFWFGIAYQVFSDFGRSVLRPAAAWCLCVVVFAAYFIGQNPDIARERTKPNQHGLIGQVVAYSTTALRAVTAEHPPKCFQPDDELSAVDGKGNGFTGLVERVRNQTNLVNEALSVAYHNALIVLDSSGDSMHRAYGCLYGVERYGGNPVAFVPRNVAIASGIQKLLSAIFIFLFGLALRNMLKVK